MSDTALNKIIQYGTNAERIAFTPDPAASSQVLYIWFETDNEPDTYAWDGSAWVQINPAVTSGINQLTGDVTAGPGTGSQAATIANNAVVTATINAKAVTYAKIQDISATARVLGRKTAGAGVTEELTESEVLDLLGSAAQGDILFRGASAWQYLAPGAAGTFLKSQGASADLVWDTPAGGAGAMTLLHEGEGTSSATGATTVDSYALASQLTVKDTLMILVTLEANGNSCTAPGLKNSTDSVAFPTNSMASATDESFVAWIRNVQSTLTRVDYWQQGYSGTTQIPDQKMRATFSTNWTGNWTLSLVYAALGAGATFTYRWAIYKIAGQ